MKARRKAQKQANESARQNETLQFDGGDVVEQATNYDDEQAERDIFFLRRTVYDESMEQIFAKKLKDTKHYRKNLCKDLNIDIIERFPYFFTNTDLVSLWLNIPLNDLGILNMNALKLLNGFVFIFRDQILLDFDVCFNLARDIFLKKWYQIKDNIKSVHGSKGFERNEILAKFGGEIEPMLMLLQMLPDVPKGTKSSKKRSTFEESVNNFIVFLPVIHLTKVFV